MRVAMSRMTNQQRHLPGSFKYLKRANAKLYHYKTMQKGETEIVLKNVTAVIAFLYIYTYQNHNINKLKYDSKKTGGTITQL